MRSIRERVCRQSFEMESIRGVIGTMQGVVEKNRLEQTNMVFFSCLRSSPSYDVKVYSFYLKSIRWSPIINITGYFIFKLFGQAFVILLLGLP